MANSLESPYNTDTDEKASLLRNLQGARGGMKCNGRLWKVKSKGAILTLILNFLVLSSFYTLLWMVSEIKSSTALELYGPGGVALAFLTISCPVAGWLADARYGRYKVLRCGLWLTWIGTLSITVVVLLAYKFDDCELCQNIFYTGGLVGVVLLSFGLSAYMVNAVQFGIDQMPEASSDELSAFIHWFVWVMFAAELTGRLAHLIGYCVPIARHNSYIAGVIQLMVPMAMLSLALCCEFLLHEWLIIEPGNLNSLKTIVRVLKFAATRKYPIMRRAITYCEDKKPSRIDFAKDKYGGPYTTEQVEDVKTCFRIVGVALSTTALLIPFFLFILSVSYLLALTSHGVCTLVSQQTAYSISLFAVTIIPLYTFIIHPLVKNRVLSMLLRVVLAAALTVILSGTLLTVNSVKHALDPDIVCMFSNSKNLDLIPELWLVIPLNFITAVEAVLYVTAIFEFICAQSPYSMRGLLFGLLCSVMLFSLPIADGIFFAWNNFKEQIPPSCDFYYLLFQFVSAVVGLIVLCIVARWYKRRTREEEDDQRRIVEEIFDRELRSHSGTREGLISAD